ncbi:MAG TPA: TetR family transcriptional regulator [Mycobacterium sp.]
MRSAGEATRERILAAAKTEFAERGLAGARINRIATEANASKERLYAYFSSKEALFAAVTERLVLDVTAETGAARGDMAAYVGLLFDNLARNPENARLHDWLLVGRADQPESAPQLLAFKRKIDDIREGQESGLIDSTWDPAQLLIMLIEIAKTMAHPQDSLRPLLKGNRRANSRAARRAAAVEAARKLSAPDAGLSSGTS